MQRYDTYKDSGVKWLGEIPSHWEVKRFKHFGTFSKGKLPKNTNLDGIGLPIIGASEMNGKEPSVFTEDLNVPHCLPYDILILWDGANAGLVANNKKGVVASTAVKYSCFDNSVNNRYLFYLIKNYQRYYKDKVSGTTIPHMNIAFINDTPLLVPKYAEQTAIAAYLDTATAKIDAAIAQQQKMIDLLNERKQIIINRAVTKGLNPNAKMKDSGVEWIGEVPEGWEVMPLKYCAKTNSGSTPKTIAGKDNNNSRIRWVRTTDLNNDIVYDTSEYLSLKEMRSASCPLLPKDTVLISMYGGAGSFGKLGILNMEATINQALCSISCDSIALPKYMFYYLQSIHSIWMKFAESTRKDPNLNQQTIRSISVILPSVKEQQNIVDYIESLNSGLNTAVSNIYKQISLLQERKQIIIDEVVTGKVKVTN